MIALCHFYSLAPWKRDGIVESKGGGGWSVAACCLIKSALPQYPPSANSPPPQCLCLLAFEMWISCAAAEKWWHFLDSNVFVFTVFPHGFCLDEKIIQPSEILFTCSFKVIVTFDYERSQLCRKLSFWQPQSWRNKIWLSLSIPSPQTKAILGLYIFTFAQKRRTAWRQALDQ